ncbi:hypothetical protein [Bremerella alba]|uniref:DUF3990 domain-containing protein n=1 Tax=Bremerella alba TaxID=980252 RepID=A0A7V9A9V2_9BACT|nr:hypothetical protein [Bremerella alba]MBA2117728.1 hypothetical protein [Bremerella alba]
MTLFNDYHRTVVGYHGTTLSVALRLVNRISKFTSSDRDYDWLGKGVYFWEYAPKQALNFAQIRQTQLKKKRNKNSKEEYRANEPLAVVAGTIRLGFCLDLTDPENIKYVSEVYKSFQETMDLTGEDLPKNTRRYRKLDRAVFDYAYKVIEESDPNSRVDTARGVYVPASGSKRIWEGSWIAHDTHLQICVRNTASILGLWLHHPTKLEVSDACETLKSSGAIFN